MVGKMMRLTLAGVVVLAMVAMAPAASAKGTVVTETGSCSDSTDWKLKLKSEDAGIEVEFEVDSNISGQDWKVKIFHNGKRIFHGTKTTHGASGSFEVKVTTNDKAGIDKFRGRAKNPSTGELCIGKAQF
jgi:hypothetical protein